ncbi:MAG: AAA family ATPase [Nitrososphaerota archaeon]
MFFGLELVTSMTVVVSVQHSRSGSGATTVASTLAYILSMHGRTLYIEADFLNPVIEKLTRSTDIFSGYSNEWIIGEKSLNELARDVGRVFNLESGILYFLSANPSDDSRRRMEVLDSENDERILKALEDERWVVGGSPLDYVVIDTPPWMDYVLACVSYVSNYVVYVIKPKVYELSVLEDRIENIYSNFVCLVNPVINMYRSDDEDMRRFEEKLKERTHLLPRKIPYIHEFASGLDMPLIFTRKNKMYNYLIEYVQEIVEKPKLYGTGLKKESATMF